MFNYRDVLPILVDINLIIIMSIYIISLCLYLANKEKKIKMINYLYFLDLAIFTIAIINSYMDGKSNSNTYILAIYAFMKIVYTIKSKNKLGININSINMLLGTSLIQITSLFFIPNIFYILNILINLIITQKVYVEYLNKTYKKVNKNLNKLSKNKINLSKIENKINKEKLVQQETKNKLLNLESKIDKAISEVDMPIFTLDKKNQINSSNEAFKLELDKKNIEVLNDIYLYLDKMFINSTDAIELIRKSYDYNQESIELYTNEEKIYKFTCINDTYKNESIKVCILNDITQTTVIQKKLIESEEKYRKLMDILSDGVIIHDMNNVNYINESAISLFNLDCDKKNVSINDIKSKINKKSIDKFKRNIKFVNEDKIEKLSNKIKTEDGLFIELITTKININDTNKLLTIAIDITSIEKAIRE
ncbi:MAG: PAS domain-containing protein, partial [Paraclostridium sp.]